MLYVLLFIYLYLLKKNLVITTKYILFSVLVQHLVNIIKHNNSNYLIIIIKIKLALVDPTQYNFFDILIEYLIETISLKHL